MANLQVSTEEEAYIKVTIKSILQKFNEKIPYLQPVYETIVNALEAKAHNIVVEFYTNLDLYKNDDTLEKKVTSFTVSDDGEGFIPKNRISFSNFMSDLKEELGCKGVGRFTWLKVFEDIHITSLTKTEKVDFDFNTKFSLDKITPQSYISESSSTKITFSNPTKAFYNMLKSGKIKTDKREIADLEIIKNKIEDYLQIKLFLLHEKQNYNFKITLKMDGKELLIDNNSIKKLEHKTFTVQDDVTDELFPKGYIFTLYYTFDEDGKGSSNQYYCAHGRTVTAFTKNVYFKNKLPNNDSLTLLLTSPYFDEVGRVNNERNEFNFNINDNNKTLTNPIPIPTINEKLKNVIDEVLLSKYPDLDKDNEKIVEEAISEYPYLSKYIKADTSKIKNRNYLIKMAEAEFKKDKENTRNNFVKLLSKKKISADELIKSMSQINEVSARELAEYFLYREQIIKGLQQLLLIKNYKEEALHNLFMNMGDISNNESESYSKYDSNLWILDDKFLSYSCAFSDKQIKQILEHIRVENSLEDGADNEPDLAIFYNNIFGSLRDIVVIELKSANAPELQKGTSIWELSRNMGPIAECVDNVRNMYGYIIMDIDAKMEKRIGQQPGVSKLFSHGESPIFYFYNNNLVDKNNQPIITHNYIISLEAICKDAEMRNKTFIDIIKNN